MNFIAGYLILITKNEEESFWLLDALVGRILPGMSKIHIACLSLSCSWCYQNDSANKSRFNENIIELFGSWDLKSFCSEVKEKKNISDDLLQLQRQVISTPQSLNLAKSKFGLSVPQSVPFLLRLIGPSYVLLILKSVRGSLGYVYVSLSLWMVGRWNKLSAVNITVIKVRIVLVIHFQLSMY